MKTRLQLPLPDRATPKSSETPRGFSTPPLEAERARFERSIRPISSELYRFAFWLCGEEEMAKEVLQEALTRAWRSFPTLRDEKKIKTWLLTIIRREHARQFEGHKPRHESLDVVDDVACYRDDEDQEIAALRRAIASLPVKYREPLILQVLGGYTGDEIAEILNIPRPTVGTHLFRARQKLGEMLSSGEDEIPSSLSGTSSKPRR